MKNIYERIVKKQFKIDRIITLEKFRRFLIYACYYNEKNKSKDTLDFLLKNRKFFPMREGNGKIEYIADEVFPYEFRSKVIIIYAKNIKEINYNSKSGNTKLKWIRINEYAGRLIGVASFRALMVFYRSKSMKMNEIIEIIKGGNMNGEEQI
jgi:hypothetical protein